MVYLGRASSVERASAEEVERDPSVGGVHSLRRLSGPSARLVASGWE